MNRLRDLREYIGALKAIGELQEINKEIDRNLEIGAIVRRSYDLRAPLRYTTLSAVSSRASGCCWALLVG
jgi:UbiD family decarboxylase